MRLSKPNSIPSTRHKDMTAAKTVAIARERVIQNPAALLVIGAALAALLIPAVGTAVTNTETIGEEIVDGEPAQVIQPTYDEEHGEATVVIDGEEYTSENGELDITVSDAEQVEVDGSNSESASTKVTITSTSSSDEDGNQIDEQTVIMNGEEVEQSRTGRFSEEIEDEYSETEIKGRIEGNAVINIEVN